MMAPRMEGYPRHSPGAIIVNLVWFALCVRRSRTLCAASRHRPARSPKGKVPLGLEMSEGP
jgi:hypothetical protein